MQLRRHGNDRNDVIAGVFMVGRIIFIGLSLLAAIIIGIFLAFIFRAEWFPEQLVIRYHPVEATAFTRYCDFRNRHELFYLHRFPRRFTRPYLETQLQHRDPAVAAIAAVMLIEQYETDGMEAFLAVAENDEIIDRVLKDPLSPTALNSLSAILSDSDSKWLRPAMTVLLTAPAEAGRDRLIAENLARFSDAEERSDYIGMLPQEDEKREIDDSLKWELLRLCREDPDPLVRFAALSAFSENGFVKLSPEAERYFQSLAINPETPEEWRAQAVRNLLNHKTEYLLTLLAIANPPDYIIDFEKEVGAAFESYPKNDFPAKGVAALLQRQYPVADSLLEKAREQGVINQRFCHQYTALDLAIMMKDPDAARVLRKFGAKTAAELPPDPEAAPEKPEESPEPDRSAGGGTTVDGVEQSHDG